MPGGKFGFEVLEAVDGEIDSAVGERFMDFLCEQPLAADIGQAAGLLDVAGGADGVFLEHRGVAHEGVFRSTGQKCMICCRKARVCTRASGEARLPTRSGKVRLLCEVTALASMEALGGGGWAAVIGVSYYPTCWMESFSHDGVRCVFAEAGAGLWLS